MGGQFGIISTGGPYGQMGGQSQKGVKSVGTFSGVLGANCRGRGGGEGREATEGAAALLQQQGVSAGK